MSEAVEETTECGGGDSADTTAQISDDVIQAQLKLDDLYNFRDHFFDSRPVSEAAQRAPLVAEVLKKTVDYLESQKEVLPKSWYYLLRGKAYNILSDFSPEAFEALSRAVKLDPGSLEAWNQLGESYWKKGDVEAARNCFQDALKWSVNKVSLRNLSMALRQIGKEPSERVANIQESVELAKRAVQVEVGDGASWVVLANAYLSQFFFARGSRAQLLQLSMAAYNQAEKDKVAAMDPDLHHNRAMLYLYLSEYESALKDLSLASALDPAWDEPKTKTDQILSHLTKITDMLQRRGCLKPKKITQLISSITPQDLGPYASTVNKSDGSKTQLAVTSLSSLQPGQNPGKVILTRVTGTYMGPNDLCLMCTAVDLEGTCILLAIYNLSATAVIKPEDALALGEPNVIAVTVTYEGANFTFNLIRVENPLEVVLNRQAMSAEKRQETLFTFYNKAN